MSFHILRLLATVTLFYLVFRKNNVMSLETELFFLAGYSDEIEFTKRQLCIIY